MRIALIGDIHTYRLAVAPWRLFNKRLLGQVNLWFNRRFRFRRELLPPVWERVTSIDPEMLLFSGDVSTCALQSEFADVSAMIKPLTDRIPTVMTPGNHDRYTFGATKHKLMERELSHVMPDSNPHFQKLTDRWQLLVLDSAFPQKLWAEGFIGQQQIEAARQHIRSMADDQSLIVMCHYPALRVPPYIHEGPGHELRDADAVCDLLRETARLRGPVVYLHGHIHRPWCFRPGGEGLEHIVDVNAGAPCNRVQTYPFGQGFWQLDLHQDDPHIELIHHCRADDGEQWNESAHAID